MKRFLGLLVAGSLVIFGCGDDDNPAKSSEDLLAEGLLVGTWSNTNGDFGEIVFSTDGTYVDWDGDPGTWSINGDELTTIVSGESITFTFVVNDRTGA